MITRPFATREAGGPFRTPTLIGGQGPIRDSNPTPRREKWAVFVLQANAGLPSGRPVDGSEYAFRSTIDPSRGVVIILSTLREMLHK